MWRSCYFVAFSAHPANTLNNSLATACEGRINNRPRSRPQESAQPSTLSSSACAAWSVHISSSYAHLFGRVHSENATFGQVIDWIATGATLCFVHIKHDFNNLLVGTVMQKSVSLSNSWWQVCNTTDTMTCPIAPSFSSRSVVCMYAHSFGRSCRGLESIRCYTLFVHM